MKETKITLELKDGRLVRIEFDGEKLKIAPVSEEDYMVCTDADGGEVFSGPITVEFNRQLMAS